MATLGQRMVGAMKLDVNTFEEIERDPSAITQAVAVILITSVASGIGNIYYGGLTGIFGGLIGSLLGFLAWAGLVFAIGTKVMPDPATKADFQETFRVVAFAASPGVFLVVGIIPLIGWLFRLPIAIWMFIAMVVAVRQVLDYSDTAKALLVCVLGFIAYVFFSLVLSVMF
jgi:hypothetical protein